MAAPPPELMQDPVEEILLRFPPEDPASLLRAALVCKRWLRIVSSGHFRRRFRSFHRTPPMLGAIVNQRRFVPTSSFHFKVPAEFKVPNDFGNDPGWRVLDARHGRVLFGKNKPGEWGTRTTIFSIWDPITGEKLDLPEIEDMDQRFSSYAVLCAATGCNHLDCSRGPFLVVVLEINLACVYSSNCGQWSDTTVGPQSIVNKFFEFLDDHDDKVMGGGFDLLAGVLAGDQPDDAVYFLFHLIAAMVKFDLKTRELELIDLPVTIEGQRIAPITTEDGSLGFAAVTRKERTLHLWSRVVGTDEEARWVQSRVIDLKRLLPVDTLKKPPVLLLSVGVIFLYTSDGEIVSIDVKSNQARKMPQELVQMGKGTRFYDDYVVPFISFCTPAPAQRAASEDEEPMAGASSA